MFKEKPQTEICYLYYNDIQITCTNYLAITHLGTLDYQRKSPLELMGG